MNRDERRADFTNLIARQRHELGAAYANLAQPLHYAELGLRGFGFIRQFPWIVVLAPTLLSAVFSSLGFLLRRGEPAKLSRKELREIEEGIRRPRSTAMIWVGRGLKLLQFAFKLRRLFL